MESNISAPQAIGKRIALLRQEKGLTQTELGNMIHQRREIVSYWENGSRDIKSGDIVLLADALDTTCDYILRGIQAKNIDIYKATGLSDEAISYLQQVYPPDIDELNFLLESQYTEQFLLDMNSVTNAAARLVPLEHTLQALRQAHAVTDELTQTFIKWRSANDKYDLALFRWTKTLLKIADEIKAHATERGYTDEEP
jgi:transcriptional regulator with XRE-family HTH domain